MLSRRQIVLGVGAGAFAASLPSYAQQPTKVFRIGFLGSEPEARYVRLGFLETLRSGLRDAGYVEGKNIVIEFRFADGKLDRLAGLAAELVKREVDVIVTHGVEGPIAAARATSKIPIIFASGGDVVASGLVASLARPGGNMTGTIFFIRELMAKRLELITEIVPHIPLVAVLLIRDSPAAAGYLPLMGITAKSLKVELQKVEVGGPADFEDAFAAMAKKRVIAVVIPENPQFITNAEAIANLATRNRILSVGYNESFAAAGGTIGYGVNFLEHYRRVGYFVHKILTGTNPGDIPVEQPTKFELVINAKTAKVLDIKIPPAVLLRADRVIA